jgi:AI-2 transport protein TqsA
MAKYTETFQATPVTGESPPTDRYPNSLINTVSLLILAACAVAVALWYTRPVMVPFVLAIFITYLVSPLVDFLRVRARMPRILAVAVTLLVAAAILALLAMLIVTSTGGLLDNIDLYRARIVTLAERFTSVLDRTGVDLGQDVLVEGLRELPILTWVQRGAGTAVGLVTSGALVMIFVIYLLIGRHPNQLRTGIYAEIDSKVRRYIVVKVSTSAATGILTGVILALFGLDLALVFGVMAFLLNFIPSIGSAIATLLPLPIALIQFQSLSAVAMVILLPGAVQFTIGNIVEPLFMGEGLDLHPVTILISLVIWGLIWGAVGALLAAPIMAIVKIVCSRLAITRPVADLLAGRLPRSGPITAEMLIPVEMEDSGPGRS